MGRFLTKQELRLWDEYERVLDTIPNGRGYDRLSLHAAFPELKKAFDGYCLLSKIISLGEKTNDE